METKEYTTDQEQLARFRKKRWDIRHESPYSTFWPNRIVVSSVTSHEVFTHIESHRFPAFERVKDSGLIQGSIEPPKVRYCINRENWAIAKNLFVRLFDHDNTKKSSCC